MHQRTMIHSFSIQVTKEAVRSVHDREKPAKKEETKNVNTAVYDEATAVDETSDIAIIQAATGCQVMFRTTSYPN